MTARWLNDHPDSPSAWDDEFDSDDMDPKWLRFGSNGWVRGPLDPYASFSTGTHQEALNLKQKSWWLIQSVANSLSVGPHGLGQIITLPTECFMCFRGRVNSRRTSVVDGDGEIFLTVGDAFSPANYVQCGFDSFGGIQEALFARRTPALGYINFGLVKNYFGEANPLEYIGIQKLTNTYHGWAAPSSGNWIWLGSFTHSIALPYVQLRLFNNSTSAPGNMIVGIDFFRIITGRKLP